MNGYIYLRTHESYKNTYKLGKATNLPDRNSQYVTGELTRGKFIIAFYVGDKMSKAEILLKHCFKNYNVYYDSGTEFYKKDILPLIAPCLTKLGITFKILNENDIDNLCHTVRIKEPEDKIEEIISSMETIYIDNKIKPRPDQIEIINETINYLSVNDKVTLCLMCGVGKTLISLWIAKQLNLSSIIIGVPNILLLKQWEKSINLVFDNVSLLTVHSGVQSTDISNYLNKDDNNIKIIITTYHSIKKFENITYNFGLKINDEMHHLTGLVDSGLFTKILNIKSEKQLSLTATLKKVENNNAISNDKPEYFGEVLINRCLLWAINNKIVCDYKIQTIIVDADQIEITENKQLYLAAFCALKSIMQDSHHILIYANNIKNAEKIIEYVNQLVEYFQLSIYAASYTSEKVSRKNINIIDDFTNAKKGILSCVYCLGEGWDLPLLDGVVFAENMTSNIRIVQSALRAGRLDKNDPGKINKIILPIVSNSDCFSDEKNTNFQKVREVIYQMGLEDEKIMEKVKIYKTTITKNDKTKIISYTNEDINVERLNLRSINRSEIKLTYANAKKILANKKILSLAEYAELCNADNRFYADPRCYGKNFNWIDYLSIPRTYYNIDECKNKYHEFLSIYKDIVCYLDIKKSIDEICKKPNHNFPPADFWSDYYFINQLEEIFKPKKKVSGVLF